MTQVNNQTAVPAIQTNRINGKTPEQRAQELEVLLGQAKEKAVMPEEVRQITDMLSGQGLFLGKKKLVEIPPTAEWGSYESKKGVYEGHWIYNCLGRFKSIPLFNLGKYHVTMTVQLSILPIIDKTGK